MWKVAVAWWVDGTLDVAWQARWMWLGRQRCAGRGGQGEARRDQTMCRPLAVTWQDQTRRQPLAEPKNKTQLNPN